MSDSEERTKRVIIEVVTVLLIVGLTGCGIGPFEPIFVTVTPAPAAAPSASATPTPIPEEPSPSPTASAVVTTDQGAVDDVSVSPTPAPTRQATTYEVQPGDTLLAIAAEFGLSMESLMAVNEIDDPDTIWIGQVLQIPAGGNPAPEAASDPSPTETPMPVDTAAGDQQEGSTESTLSALPAQVYLESMTHDWQKMNNCGPTTVAMALSYYGETLTQFDTAPILKGSELDKNVSPSDLAAYLRSQGYPARIFINGDIETVQRLLANDIPVISEQWLIREGDPLTGHYRLVRGYDENAGVFISNDSYLGPNVRFTYAEFDRRWRGFNRLYIPIYRTDQEPLVRQIVGDDWDEQAMYRRALQTLQAEVDTVGDLYAWFNLGDAYLGAGRYEEAVAAYERAISFGLPERMLWYRFGPFEAYNGAGQYEETIALATAQLQVVPALEEVLYYRGVAYERLGQFEQARADYRAAVDYNQRFRPAQEALAALQ